MTKTNKTPVVVAIKKQKNLANPVELQETLSHYIGNVGELQVSKTYSVGDEYILNTEVYKVVEVLGDGEYHLKNTKEPYNSFLTSEDEVTK